MAISASAARADLFNLIDRVNDDQEAVEIATKRGSAYLVPEQTYRSMVETLHLLRSRNNAQHLLTSLDQVGEGRLTEHELYDEDDGADLDSVREWARQNGHEVSASGRPSPSLLDLYDEAKPAR